MCVCVEFNTKSIKYNSYCVDIDINMSIYDVNLNGIYYHKFKIHTMLFIRALV